MVESSWCGLLAGLSLILRLSQTSATTEAALRAFQSFIRVSGVLRLRTPRDAFITAVCTSCLPEHFSVALDPPAKGWQVWPLLMFVTTISLTALGFTLAYTL